MKQYNGYKAEMMSSFDELPTGGYICKIMNAEEKETRNGGSRLEVSIDIAEGEHKGYYANLYKSDTREDKKWRGVFNIFLPRDDGSEKDGWAKNKFNNFIGCVEDANGGYRFDWDEKKLKGKLVALVFRREEYKKQNGSTGWTVKPFKCIPIGDCRDGKWGKYEDKPLANSSGASVPAYAHAEDEGGDLPF